jgi:Pacifastin inhibitor (LCMII)
MQRSFGLYSRGSTCSTLALGLLTLMAAMSCRPQTEGDDECLSDSDCLHGYCDIGVTCAAIGCPPPPPNVCTTCGDGSELRCRRAYPDCPGDLVPEIVNGCYGACVDRYSCTAPSDGTCEYNGVTYQAGDSFKSADGCNDCTCVENGLVACTLKLCVCNYDDPARRWVSKDPMECQLIDFVCEPGQQQFVDQACGCGCQTTP